MIAQRVERAQQLFTTWIYPGEWRRQYVFNAHRKIREPQKRANAAALAAAVVRARHGRPFSAKSPPIVADGARALRSHGIVDLGRILTPEQVDEIVAWLPRERVRSVYHPELGEFAVEDAPLQCNVVEYSQETILRAPYVLDIVNDVRILAMVEQFLGAKPTLSNLSLWWSLAGRPAPKEAQFFHRDVDDLAFCKLFIYLTDVTMDSGPHVFVRNSPPVDACTGLGRYGDDEVRAAFGEDAITYVCGERGRSFIANTFGVHKGLLPSRGNRLLFQAQYSLFPIMQSRYEPSRLPAFRHDSYVNRLYVRG